MAGERKHKHLILKGSMLICQNCGTQEESPLVGLRDTTKIKFETYLAAINKFIKNHKNCKKGASNA